MKGLQFGGWTIDDFCVVANPNSICGDGVVSNAEQCDDGSANANSPDACRTTCRLSACGDGIVDSEEDCEIGDDNCNLECQFIKPEGCGCSVGGPDRTDAYVPVAALWLLGLLFVRRRRRSS